jgi:hypothetical protein
MTWRDSQPAASALISHALMAWHKHITWYNIFLSQQNNTSRLISRKNHQPNSFIIISIIFTKDTIVALAQYDM